MVASKMRPDVVPLFPALAESVTCALCQTSAGVLAGSTSSHSREELL